MSFGKRRGETDAEYEARLDELDRSYAEEQAEREAAWEISYMGISMTIDGAENLDDIKEVLHRLNRALGEDR